MTPAASNGARPHVSNDNPQSEAAFKTLKYRPTFPDRFGSIEDARSFCRRFFDWYNSEHYQSGNAWHHPIDVHYGQAWLVQTARADVLAAAAYERNPERFVRNPPEPRALPEAAWINKPPARDQQTDRGAAHSKKP